ncbi:hypothetical protein [Polynucleobacter sinensis]|uniref:hypothetical protein n=1 Tax=Polynucleobacter sinensis TaxID=1743157 RepID=UPI000783A2A3|nr:hypothetical protein [Polynucleobacter sinensis]
MRFYEFNSLKPQKPLTPAQARIKSLKDQAKRAQAAVKAERARQKIQAGQRELTKVESTKKMTSNSFKAQYKMNNPYSSWMTAGTYRNFNDALAAALRKKKAGAIVVRVEDGAKMVIYSS